MCIYHFQHEVHVYFKCSDKLQRYVPSCKLQFFSFHSSKMSQPKPTSPDEIIEELGGCGRFQKCMGFTVHLTKTLISFSVMSTIMLTATPNWWCIDDSTDNNNTVCTDDNGNKTRMCHEKTCRLNNTKCVKYEFSGVRTAVSEVRILLPLGIYMFSSKTKLSKGILIINI